MIKGGTQTSGYQKGIGRDGRSSKQVINHGSCGAGGGGGGYWGGEAETDNGDSTQSGGGGGSGFLSGLLGCITKDIVFYDGNLLSGNNNFKSPESVNETGHSGNGFVRITVLEIAINSNSQIKSLWLFSLLDLIPSINNL